MTQPLLLLVVEDDSDYVELLRRALSAHRRPFEVVWVDTLSAARSWLAENTPDLILTDLYLPDGSGKALLPQNDQPLPYPVIIQTAFGDEQKAVEMIKAGAYDYLPKRFDFFHELPYLLERAVQEWRHQRERQEMEARLLASQSVFQAIFENAPVGVYFIDEKGVIKAANPAVAQLHGVPRENLLGMELLNMPVESIRSAVKRTLEGERVLIEEDFRDQPFQNGRAIRGLHAPVQLPDGRVIGGVVILQDITAEKNEQDLRQALYQIASLAQQATDAEALYRGIHQIVGKILPAENFYIALWDKVKNGLSFPYWVNQFDPSPGVVPFAKGLTEVVLQRGETLLAEDELRSELEKQGLIERIGISSQAWLGAPLRDHQGEVFGAVVVQTYDPKVRYNPHQVKMMEYIAAQIAQVLERFRAEEAERKQRRLAEALLQATTALSESLEVEQVFECILAQLQRLLSYDNCTITLIEGEWLQVVAQAGIQLPQNEEAQHLRWQQFDTFSQISRTGAPILIPDVREYPKWRQIAGLEWVRSYLGLPLNVKGKVIGFLSLEFSAPSELDAADVDSLMAFANLAAQAIENARLFQQAQALAIHDELTGIYNRRGLKMFAQREFERSVRFHRPLSLLFSDIDDFKAFNDRYSYAVGDRVLRAVAACLKDNLREVDITARYGGDEFVIVLPETGQRESINIVERLRSMISALTVETDHGAVSIALSFGLAERIKSDVSWEHLLERASTALRLAKQDDLPLVIADGNQGI